MYVLLLVTVVVLMFQIMMWMDTLLTKELRRHQSSCRDDKPREE